MTTTPEFSRPLAIEALIPDKVRSENITASEEECAALAERFDLQILSNLKAQINVMRVSEGNIIRVQGHLEAEVVQTCVVSLQGVPDEIDAHFETYFTEDGKEDFGDETLFDIEIEDEAPDMVMKDGVLDLGELVAQYLSLELDPYPRAPGVSLPAQMTEAGGDKKNRPFEILQKLKTEKDE